LKPGEFISEIWVPEQPLGTRSGFLKYTERDVWDFATVSGALVYTLKGDRISSGRMVFGGIAPKPWLDKNVGNALSGLKLDTASIDQAASQVLTKAEPMTHNAYKLTMAQNILKQLLT